MLPKRRRASVALISGLVLAGVSLAGPVQSFEGAFRSAPTAPDPSSPSEPQTGAGLGSELSSAFGDLDALVARGTVRALVVARRTEGRFGRLQTHALDAVKAFEAHLKSQLGSAGSGLRVVPVPVGRNELIPALLEGRGDVVTADLAITEEDAARVEFSTPFLASMRHVVVTGRGGPMFSTLDELSGQTLMVRAGSPALPGLADLNARLRSEGRAEVSVVLAEPGMEDGDLLEQADGGALPPILVDAAKARFWARALSGITVHYDAAILGGSEVAWAVRPDSPLLKEAVDRFAEENPLAMRSGSGMPQMASAAQRAPANRGPTLRGGDMDRLRDTAPVFRRYGEQYGVDWVMVAAVAHKESRLNPNAYNPAGYVGIMQMSPQTAASRVVRIPDVRPLDNNIHAGTRYLRYIMDEYLSDPRITPLDRHLMAIAGYNAGPGHLQRARDRASARGLDPNRWFGNVETVFGREVSPRTVRYVGAIYRTYSDFQRLAGSLASR